ncbi:PucR family transcriptional regulator [Enteractinococcus coprophilus]|uniref:PucR-like helix-turn-helix protein n=1 Tax=Enteractinococcus coprophilus TaxID=1027633 RepID=A0A543AIQ3_9MICC|nr:PucR family transcriptional regulator [Enteractinococcus coprophilus]TQL72454.1 PucR-like helix-turn-helix protein [Enteractinococcus coprophilus]
MKNSWTAKIPRPISADAKAAVRAHLGELKTAVLHQLNTSLPWYRDLPAHQRASLGEIAQQGLTTFADWFEHSENTIKTSVSGVLHSVFGNAPTELSRTVSLQQAVQLLRTVLQVVETQVPAIVAEPDKAAARYAVVFYSREIAFALAEVYARAAETRGSWDARLEALLLDSILAGDRADEIRSRAAATGWKANRGITVMVGRPDNLEEPQLVAKLREIATRAKLEILIGVLSDRLVIVLGNIIDVEADTRTIQRGFGEGPIVYGRIVESLVEAPISAQEALEGYSAAPAWPAAPRPVAAYELLPERALNGDNIARAALTSQVYRPLSRAGHSLLETVDVYTTTGGSLEATARQLFIHANTVRYRLKRVAELTGWDPTSPRDAYVLQVALMTGRLDTVLNHPQP